MKKNRSFRKYFIMPKFQVVLILLMVINIVFLVGVSFWAIYSEYGDLYDLGVKAGFDGQHSYFKFLEFQQHNIVKNFIGAVIISLIFTLSFTLYISHRLAGPLWRLKKHLFEIIRNGEYIDISFRKKDYLKDFEPLINEAFQKLAEKEK